MSAPILRSVSACRAKCIFPEVTINSAFLQFSFKMMLLLKSVLNQTREFATLTLF